MLGTFFKEFLMAKEEFDFFEVELFTCSILLGKLMLLADTEGDFSFVNDLALVNMFRLLKRMSASFELGLFFFWVAIIIS